MSEFKPCPFCGGIGTLWSIDQCDTVYAVCQNCGARTVDYKHAEEAIAAWNRRAHTDSCEISKYTMSCEECGFCAQPANEPLTCEGCVFNTKKYGRACSGGCVRHPDSADNYRRKPEGEQE